MRLFEMNNGRGSQSRRRPTAAVISPACLTGGSIWGYLAPCGYVAPAYYDPVGDGGFQKPHCRVPDHLRPAGGWAPPVWMKGNPCPFTAASATRWRNMY